MEKHQIDRINELARKKKAEGLTPQEMEEQRALRLAYLAAFRAGFASQMDNIWVQDEDGIYEKIQKKKQ